MALGALNPSYSPSSSPDLANQSTSLSPLLPISLSSLHHGRPMPDGMQNKFNPANSRSDPAGLEADDDQSATAVFVDLPNMLQLFKIAFQRVMYNKLYMINKFSIRNSSPKQSLSRTERGRW
ncbi:hypothetical protein KSP39_PZI023481 [Platanthera zijinensis]|uniref:Uncharacterized protein n=1 Tax=Platanthera zijinensis TaxID=2320716 RepID=A0AAP0FUC6_9ASPA